MTTAGEKTENTPLDWKEGRFYIDRPEQGDREYSLFEGLLKQYLDLTLNFPDQDKEIWYTKSALFFLVRECFGLLQRTDVLETCDAGYLHSYWQAAAYLDSLVKDDEVSRGNINRFLADTNGEIEQDYCTEARNLSQQLIQALIDDWPLENCFPLPENQNEQTETVYKMLYGLNVWLKGLCYLKIHGSNDVPEQWNDQVLIQINSIDPIGGVLREGEKIEHYQNSVSLLDPVANLFNVGNWPEFRNSSNQSVRQFGSWLSTMGKSFVTLLNPAQESGTDTLNPSPPK